MVGIFFSFSLMSLPLDVSPWSVAKSGLCSRGLQPPQIVRERFLFPVCRSFFSRVGGFGCQKGLAGPAVVFPLFFERGGSFRLSSGSLLKEELPVAHRFYHSRPFEQYQPDFSSLRGFPPERLCKDTNISPRRGTTWERVGRNVTPPLPKAS